MKNKILVTTISTFFYCALYAQNPDMSLVPYRQGNLWGYAGPDRKIVIPPAYDEADIFSEGYAAVKKGSKYGYINKAGKVVIPFKFFTAKSFRIGYAASDGKIVTADDIGENQKEVLFAPASLNAGGYEVCIDTKGNTMKGCPAMAESGLIMSPVIVEKNYSTVKQNDIFDKIVGDYKIPGSEDNYYIAMKGTSYGVFNNKFEIIVPFEYKNITPFVFNNSVHLEVQKIDGAGLLNGNGSVSIPVENSSIRSGVSFDGKPYFIVSKNGKTGIKDQANNDIVPQQYTDISYDRDAGFILTGDNNLKGFRFRNNYMLEPKYSSLKPIKGGDYVMVIMQTGRSGYINNKGEEFFVE